MVTGGVSSYTKQLQDEIEKLKKEIDKKDKLLKEYKILLNNRNELIVQYGNKIRKALDELEK
jgi:hypothetical protein